MADANTLQPAAGPGADADPADRPDGASIQEKRARPNLKMVAALVKRVIGPPPYKIDLGQVAILVAIPVFCWVFFTTSSGMVDIMRRESNDWIGIIGAFIGTTAVLVMLASTSWSLGSDVGALIARRQFLGERILVKTLVTSGVFVFVFTISAFFSFTYYYTNIFRLSSKKIVSELQPMELAADVLLPAAKLINTNYDAETARIVATPGMRIYLDSLDALLQVGNTAGSSFREETRKNQEGLQRAAADAAKRAAADLQDVQAASRQVDETRNRAAAQDQIIADLEPIIKSKQDEIVALTSEARQEDQLAVDASKGLDNLGAACGPNCQSHQGKAATARKRIATIRQTLAAPLNERANAIKQRDALAAQIITLRQKAESAASARAQPIPKEEIAPDLATTLRELTGLRTQVRSDPTWAKIRQAKASCDLIFVTTRQLKMLPAVVSADFGCEPSGAEAHDLLTARDDVIAGRAAFDEKCSLDGAIRDSMGAISLHIRNAPDVDKSAASNGFNDAKQIVDACVVAGKAAGLSEADVQSFLKHSDVFLRSHTMDRNRFELAREAFLSFTPDATMAIGVAVAQDAFMFVMKLLSEIFKREIKTRERPPLPPAMDVTDNEADDAGVRVMKTLLRASRPLHGDMSAFDANVSSVANLPEDVRDNLIGLLNRLVRERIAYIDRKGSYILDNRTLMEIEARLGMLLKRAGARALSKGVADARSLAPFFESENQDRHDAGSVGRRRRRSALDRYLSPRSPSLGERADIVPPPGAADAYEDGMREFG